VTDAGIDDTRNTSRDETTSRSTTTSSGVDGAAVVRQRALTRLSLSSCAITLPLYVCLLSFA